MSNLDKTLRQLHQKYPNAKYELNWQTPEQLLIATILAAQSTEERVNRLTVTLFQKYPTVKNFADADLKELEEGIRSTGYYRQSMYF